MTDNTVTTEAAATPATDAKRPTMKDVPQRRIFATVEDGFTALQKMLNDVEGAADLPLIIAGRDAEGNIDSTIYAGNRTMLAVLNEKLPKAENEDKGGFRPRAIVMSPLPTLDAILADDTGKEWLAGIIDTQLNNVAFRKLRKLTTLTGGESSLPVTLADFVTSESAGSNAGIMASFDSLHQAVTKAIEKLSERFKQGKPGKKAVLVQALESAAFALKMFPALETSKAAPGGLFVLWLRLAEQTAKQEGLDPAIFQHWLATRDQTAAQTVDEDEDEIDLAALMAEPSESKQEDAATAGE